MNKPPAKKSTVGQAMQQQTREIRTVHAEMSGPLPPPAMLEGYERIVPGAAERILAMAERESATRHTLDIKAVDANIAAQVTQLRLAEHKLKAEVWDAAIGKILGFAISAGAIGGCIFLAVQGYTVAAVALVGLPIAAIVQHLAAKRSPAEKK